MVSSKNNSRDDLVRDAIMLSEETTQYRPSSATLAELASGSCAAVPIDSPMVVSSVRLVALVSIQ